MVVFENGRPKNNHYRRFKINYSTGVNDYSMMEEMLRRRFKRLSEKTQVELLNETPDGDSNHKVSSTHTRRARNDTWEITPDLIIIDGGNSYYKDTQSMADKLSEKGIDFLDVGTSGGIWGLENGYSLMVGGDSVTYSKLVPLFETLAPSKGFGHVGPSGAGHFVKMIHNGIEYGMMQAYAEGFDLLKSKEDFNLDIQSISEIWSHGSVVRSWILELISDLLREDSSLKDVAPFVQDSGEGRWTVQESLDAEVPIPVISSALYARFYSRNKDKSFSAKLLSALRNQFGGHKIFKSK